MKNNNLEDEIMKKIKGGQIKLKSKYIFLAEKLGLGSAFLLSVVLAILFFSLLLFYLRVSDNLIYLSFGSSGVLAWLESFPYLLVISFVIFILFSVYLLKKTDLSYKKPFVYFLLALLIFVILSGSVLAFTKAIDRLENKSMEYGFGNQMLKPFLGSGCGCGNYSVAGRIMEIKDDWLALQTPTEIKKIDLKDLDLDLKMNLEEGFFVAILGREENEYFSAKMLKVIDDESMIMVRRNVGKRFGQDFHRRMPNNDLNTTTRECFGNCLNEDILFFECEHRCLKK